MPRGRHPNRDYEAQLKTIEEKIETHNRQIGELKAKREEIARKQQETAMSSLYSYMQENDLSAMDVISQLSASSLKLAGEE